LSAIPVKDVVTSVIEHETGITVPGREVKVLADADVVVVGAGAEWKTDASANWNNNANWQNPATFPNAAGAKAAVTKLNITADRTITLGQDITLGTLEIADPDGSHAYTIASNGHALTFDVTSGDALIWQRAVSGPTLFHVPITLNDNLIIRNGTMAKNMEFFKPITGAGKTVTVKGAADYDDTTGTIRFHSGAINDFAKLVVDGGIVWTHSTDDRNLGAVPASFEAGAVMLINGVISRGVDSTLTIHANRGITIQATLYAPFGGGFNAPGAGRHITVDSVITGAGRLLIFGAGGGTVTLNKANSFTGGTLVHPGAILKLMRTDSLPGTGPLALLSYGSNGPNYGKVNLAFTGTQTIGALYFDGVEQAAGTWGSSSSRATNKNDNWFTGSGVLNVAAVATPTVSPDGNQHSGSSVAVTVSCATPGATIRYTTDGSEPTTSSPTVADGGTLNLTLPVNLKVKAWKSGSVVSTTKTAIYMERLAAAANRKYLLIDEQYVQSTDGMQKVYHQPVKHGPPVLVADKAWEQTVDTTTGGLYVWTPPVWDPTTNRWRLWYNGGREYLPLYAESVDGLNWTKASLNLSTWNGSKNNNIINLLPSQGGYSAIGNGKTASDAAANGVIVSRDSLTTDASRRYKGVAITGWADGNSQLGMFVSPDGLNWNRLGTTQIATGDQYRFGFDECTGTFHVTTKLKFGQFPAEPKPQDDRDGGRTHMLFTSLDFQNWFGPKVSLYNDQIDVVKGKAYMDGVRATADRRQPFYDHADFADYYNMPLFEYEGMYLGLPTRNIRTASFEFEVSEWGPGNNQDSLQFPTLVSSRDLLTWNRHTREPFMDLSPLSANRGDEGMLQMVAPVRNGDELWFYYYGTRFSHAGWWELPDEVYQAAGVTKGNVRASTFSSIYVAKLRLDGFASLRAGATAGEVVTTSLPVSGKSLYVNAAAQAGTLKAELLDAATGEVIPGYSLAKSVAIKTDSVRARLQWKGVTDLSALAGRSVKIRFSVRNADLYSFWFGQ
jgi:autotransporter-associated beta strand protein